MALKPNEVKFRKKKKKKNENSEYEPCAFLFPFIYLFLFLVQPINELKVWPTESEDKRTLRVISQQLSWFFIGSQISLPVTLGHHLAFTTY